MRGFNRDYAVAIEHLQTVSIGALLEFADGDELSAGDADKMEEYGRRQIELTKLTGRD
jgi:hypothetical protein